MCKQCWGRPHRIPSLDKLDRADASAAPWFVRALTLLPELTIAELITLLAEDETLQPVCDFLINAVTPSVDQLRSLPLRLTQVVRSTPCNSVARWSSRSCY